MAQRFPLPYALLAKCIDILGAILLPAGPPRTRPASREDLHRLSSLTFRDWRRDGTLRVSTTLGACASRAAALLRPSGAASRASARRARPGLGAAAGPRGQLPAGVRGGRGGGRGRGSSAPRRVACRHRPRAPQTRLERLRRGGGTGGYRCLRAALAAAGAPGARRGQGAAPRPWPP